MIGTALEWTFLEDFLRRRRTRSSGVVRSPRASLPRSNWRGAGGSTFAQDEAVRADQARAA